MDIETEKKAWTFTVHFLAKNLNLSQSAQIQKVGEEVRRVEVGIGSVIS